jgi:MFS family permease
MGLTTLLQLEPFYHLNDTTVSLIFIAPLVGYLIAASLNSTVHRRLGQRGVAIIAPTCHVLHALVFSVHPPYPTILVAFAITGFGIGLVDSAWCAWASHNPRPNTVQGFLHGSFSMGSTFGPFIATSMFTKARLPWYTYYYVLVCSTPRIRLPEKILTWYSEIAQAGASLIELSLLTYAFWQENGFKYRCEHSLEGNHKNGLLKEASKNKVTWICALYFLACVGAESTSSVLRQVETMLTSAYSIYRGLGYHLYATGPLRFTVRIGLVRLGLLDRHGGWPRSSRFRNRALWRTMVCHSLPCIRCGSRGCIPDREFYRYLTGDGGIVGVLSWPFISIRSGDDGKATTKTFACERPCHCRSSRSNRRSILAVRCWCVYAALWRADISAHDLWSAASCSFMLALVSKA